MNIAKKKITVIFLSVSILAICIAFAEERPPLGKPVTRKLQIEFNGEKLKGFFNYIDCRSESEKQEDMERGYLKGSVLVFITGHAQRPADAFKFTNDLAEKSKSGIVIVPVCDTPFGKDKSYRGDRGKDIILMEMIRYILYENGIRTESCISPPDIPVKINKKELNFSKADVSCRLSVIGWSHGGLLSRRLSWAYPETIVSLGQICPAGYTDWRFGAFSLVGNFTIESLRIFPMLFTGKAMDVIRAGFGITKGLLGDSFRGMLSAFSGIKPARMFRTFKDIRDCTVHGTNANLPVKDIDKVIIIFAKKDSVIKPKQTGITNIENPSDTEVNRFFETYYPQLVTEKKHLGLVFSKGNHLAPIAHHGLYSDLILEHIGEDTRD